MPAIEEELQRGLRRLTRATIALYCVVAMMLVLIWADSNSKSDQLSHEITRTTHSLCALRQDLERRVASTDAFLIEHPEGIPGISVRTLRTSEDGQKRTIESLSILKCE